MEKNRSRFAINYLYFGLFFALLIVTSSSSVFIKEPTSSAPLFFFLYAAGQAALETTALIFFGWAIHKYLGQVPFLGFVGLTFVVLILHILDFLMDRILDLSVWETIAFVLDENFEDFLYLLDASGISLGIWMFGAVLILLLPLIGIGLYLWTKRFTARRPLVFRKNWLLQSFLCIPVALLFLEFSISHTIHPDAYTAFIQSLPWKSTFLQPKIVHFPLQALLTPPLEEQEMAALIEHDTTTLKKRPNIYLFVIESLREDVISADTAPNLYRFKQDNIHFDLALSNANGSHLSWFSIFHSQFPYFWHHVKTQGWAMGSPPLTLLKKWGYQIRLYSSAQLNYYGMESLLFGTAHNLIDSYQTFHHTPPLTAADSDAKALHALETDLLENPNLREGQICIVFLDSTHFKYSWPLHWNPKFHPISTGIDYFNVFQSPRKIEMIKNRYRNSVFFIDSLLGRWFEKMPRKEESIVIITGDHGEEFFEHGHLFHGSHLTHEQTNIPLYMKLGQRELEQSPPIVSQMDIFPTLLHHLSHRPIPYLEGRSIFSTNPWPYSCVARFNAGRPPYEFCLHNGQNKLIARFSRTRNIFASKSLQIRALWDLHDKRLPHKEQNTLEWVEQEFGPAIKRLFQEE
ncbi:MAG: sulfatase-like hydrolase/transferase [Chlamydiia bacterium]|nr:sulfatase-like hydrolase/transferase [Chlamydiia bacterium]